MENTEHLRKYENLKVTYEEAKVMAQQEMDESIQTAENKEGLAQLKLMVGEEQAAKILEQMLEQNAKRICLIAKHGVDAFIKAAEEVTQMEGVQILNAIDHVEEILKG